MEIADLTDVLIDLEAQVWRALVEGDLGADHRLLAPDFVGVYPTGFADRDDHIGQLADGPTVRHFEMSEPRVLLVADDTAMLSYRAEYQRVGQSAATESMYVSSLWCRRNGDWVNVFSQDTPDTGVAVV